MQVLLRDTRQAVGLGLLLGWMYCSFFSCGLVPVVSVLRSIEHVWLFSGMAMAVTSVILIFIRSHGSFVETLHSYAVAAITSSVGSVLIWTGFLTSQWNVAVSVVGGCLAGIGLTLQVVIWGQHLSGYNVAKLERDVPLAFIISFLIYFVLLAVKGPLFVVACVVMPPLSMAVAYRQHDMWQCSFRAECACSAMRPLPLPSIWRQLRGMASLLALYGMLWFQFASFRVISSPDIVGNRFLHYLVPFSCSFVIAIALFFVCVRHSRFLNYSLMYRWAVPFMVLSYGVLLFYPGGFYDQKSAAYAINFVAMFGAQLTFWTVTPKHICRLGLNPVVAFCGFILAEGLGIASGLAVTLPFVQNESAVVGSSFMGLALVVLVAMVAGFNPSWFSMRTGTDPLFKMRAEENARRDAPSAGEEPLEYRSGPCEATDTGRRDIEKLFERRALELQEEYGLTSRETEITALLLAGRSRPYIRDELFISLNTVHAHARNIYAKCDVHSHQEFMGLMDG